MARNEILLSYTMRNQVTEADRFTGICGRARESQFRTRRLGWHAIAPPAFALLACMIISCATLQAPLRDPTFPRDEMQHTIRDGIEVAAKAIVNEDQYLDLFDDNLPEIGIAAVWVEIRNTRADAIHLEPDAWSLRTGAQTASAMSVSEVYERYYAGHRVRMYSVQSDSAARTRMEKALLAEGPMAPSESRSGFVLFRIDPAAASGWSLGAVMVVRKILLDSGSTTTIEIALSHANS